MDTCGKGAHAGHGGLIVGDVYGIHMVFNQFALGGHGFGVTAPGGGGAALRCNGNMSQSEYLFQLAWCVHIHTCTSSLATVLGPPARFLSGGNTFAEC